MSQTHPRTGVIIMAVASLAVAFVDGTAKLLGELHAPLFVAFMRFALAALVLLPFGWVHFGWRMFPGENLKAHVIRTFCLAGAVALFFLALKTTGLAQAIVAFFIGPIFALFLSIVVLREALTFGKLASLVVGFCGILIAARPDQGVSPGTYLALMAGLLMGIYMVTTRLAGQSSDPLKTVIFQCVVGACILFPIAAPTITTPSTYSGTLFIVMGTLSAGIHLLVIRAFRIAPASVLAPLVYLEIVGAAAVGWLFFKDVPDIGTVIGAVLILVSGAIIFREAR